MVSISEIRKRERSRLAKMSTKKLLEGRKDFNDEFKKYAREELQRRGVLKKQIRKKNSEREFLSKLMRL